MAMRREGGSALGMIAVVSLTTCAIVAGCGAQVVGGSGATGGGGPTPTPDGTPPAEGWRWESSLGVEVAVPEDWSVNDTDCNQTDAPTIVRSQGAVNDCLTPEPPTKQIVEITREDHGRGEEPAPPAELAVEEITIDGERAQRIEGTTPDGRAAGWLRFPGLDDVLVRARVHDQELLHRILDSVRVVDVDANGCAAAREDMRAKPPRASTLLPRAATSVSICFFGQDDVIAASELVDGEKAAKLADLLNRAKPGRTPDVPANLCLRSGEVPLPDVLLVGRAEQDDAIVEVSYSDCTHRGLSNGRQIAKLGETLLEAIMVPLETGFAYNPQGLDD